MRQPRRGGSVLWHFNDGERASEGTMREWSSLGHWLCGFGCRGEASGVGVGRRGLGWQRRRRPVGRRRRRASGARRAEAGRTEATGRAAVVVGRSVSAHGRLGK
ncbi:hypothetical protein GUJ93_ZPchr0012g20661 [Zizania palustris]|uniref:Uncharacterized protein n=1 Tax=Zizania palustris TaxID=103762 RepID=A0A8J6BZ15_ZIZPA|nr:hypothetical protein GUJ93_ZPchr0012g20661 [Zizania palustris]